MKTYIMATQFPLSHATIVSAFDVVGMDRDSGLAMVDDTTLGSGCGFSGSIYSRTSQFDPLSLKPSMLSRSLASRWSVLEGGIMVSSNYSYEFSFNELGS